MKQIYVYQRDDQTFLLPLSSDHGFSANHLGYFKIFYISICIRTKFLKKRTAPSNLRAWLKIWIITICYIPVFETEFRCCVTLDPPHLTCGSAHNIRRANFPLTYRSWAGSMPQKRFYCFHTVEIGSSSWAILSEKGNKKAHDCFSCACVACCAVRKPRLIRKKAILHQWFKTLKNGSAEQRKTRFYRSFRGLYLLIIPKVKRQQKDAGGKIAMRIWTRKSWQRQRTAARVFGAEQVSRARLFAKRRNSGVSALLFL